MNPPIRESRQLVKILFLMASYLTDPVCNTHKLFRMFQIVDLRHSEIPTSYALLEKFLCLLGVTVWGIIALVATPIGILLRFLACRLEGRPFLYLEGGVAEKALLGKDFSLLSWNICCVAAGFPITDGGIMPWEYRIERIINKIKDIDADVVCLYESFGPDSGFQIFHGLKDRYANFYFNMGAQGLGVSSGLFVASKFAMNDLEFMPFPKEHLISWTKFSSKGSFGFDIQNGGTSFARIYSTHFQHSEESGFATEEEVVARQKGMDLILGKIKPHMNENKALILTGDLNLNEREYLASPWKNSFEEKAVLNGKTWGGDEFCAKLKGKQVSSAADIDYTLAVKGTIQNISISLVHSGYDPKKFTEEALSDHEGLLSKITLK